LDEIIFRIYRLTKSDRVLIQDLCRYGFELLHEGGFGSAAEKVNLPVRYEGMASEIGHISQDNEILSYVETFLEIWNRELPDNMEFWWNIVIPRHDWPMLAVLF